MTELFTDLPIETLNVDNKKVIYQEKLDLDINDFINNDIILVNSGTATGKTKNIARLATRLKEAHEGCNILSIVNLCTLADEQKQTFKKENVELLDYRKKLSKFFKNDGVICINSLHKLNDYHVLLPTVNTYDFKNTILYIDECNDLIQTLTQNEALDIIPVYNKLMSIIKKCKKIILSDATINQNTLNLLSSRTENKKIIHIKNEFKKFNGINAFKYRNANDFLKKLDDYIKEDKYFLFGCDSCRKLTMIYNDLVSNNKLKKDNIILITSETKYRPLDASEDFKNKFVFYSPSITTGVSFVYEDVKQPQFIYMSNNPQITPISFYQMSCRTRNMSELNYYSEDPKPREMKFKTLTEVETFNKSLTDAHNKIMSLSRSTDEFDNVRIVYNSFFKMFCYKEYEDSIFWTGYLKHYEQLLTKCGFVLSAIGHNKKINKEKINQIKQDFVVSREELFNTFVEHYKNKTLTEYLGGERDGGLLSELDENYEIINNPEKDFVNTCDERRALLSITDEYNLKKYEIYICDEYRLKDYYAFLRLLRTNEYNLERLGIQTWKSYDLTMLKKSYNKINLLIQFEKHYNITRFGIDYNNLVLKKIETDEMVIYEPVLMEFKDIDESKIISEEFQTLCTHAFSTRKNDKFKYDSRYELIKTYVGMVRNICGDIPIISQKRAKIKNVLQYKYYLEINEIINLVELLCLSNNSLKNMDVKLIEKLTEIKPQKSNVVILYLDDIPIEKEEIYIDEEDKLNKYIYDKNRSKAIN